MSRRVWLIWGSFTTPIVVDAPADGRGGSGVAGGWAGRSGDRREGRGIVADVDGPTQERGHATVGRRTSRKWAQWSRPLGIGLGVTAVLRVVTGVIALDAAYGSSFPHVVAAHPGVVVDVFSHWDAGFYTLIAAHGYPAAHGGVVPRTAAFGPLYPFLVASVHVLGGVGVLLAGQLVSAAALVMALAVLVRLVELDTARALSGTTVTLVAAFPTAFFLVGDYADALALALVVVAFAAARRQMWVVAGLCAGGAFLTKFYLGIVVAALLVEVWEALRARSGRPASTTATVRAAAAVVVPTVVAVVAWMVVSAQRYGDSLAFVHVQSAWGRHFGTPWALAWTTGGDLVHLRFLDTPTASVMELFDTATVLLLVAAAVYSYLRVRRSYGVLLGLALVIFTFQNMLYSESREVLALFPFFVAGGSWVVGHPWRERLVLAVFLPCAYYLVTRFVTGAFAG
jgi:hypothetical protein